MPEISGPVADACTVIHQLGAGTQISQHSYTWQSGKGQESVVLSFSQSHFHCLDVYLVEFISYQFFPVPMTRR